MIRNVILNINRELQADKACAFLLILYITSGGFTRYFVGKNGA